MFTCRNFLLKHVIEGKVKGTRRRRRRLLKKLLNLKEEALDRTLWRARFGIGYGPVARQTTQ
jgi:hypothetical protein